MAKYRNRKLKKQRKLIIVSVVSLTFIMVTAYSAFSTTLNIGAKGNIVDRSRTIQSWSSSSNEDFHTDFYRENIVSATFLDSAKVPDNAVESWDVSVNKDKGVMAYVVDSSSETGKYDLFIGAKDGVIANENSSFLFYAFSGLENIAFNNNFNTSNTTAMSWMFGGGNNLTTVDVSSFDTANATGMSGMFSAWNLADGWKVGTITRIIGLENFDTGNVTSMGDMFSGQPLMELDLSSFKTKKNNSMYHMFYSCAELTELNLCSFDTSNVIYMGAMFSSTPNLTKIKVGPNWTTTNADTTNMFAVSGVSSVSIGEC